MQVKVKKSKATMSTSLNQSLVESQWTRKKDQMQVKVKKKKATMSTTLNHSLVQSQWTRKLKK
jgi:hypothetical protein